MAQAAFEFSPATDLTAGNRSADGASPTETAETNGLDRTAFQIGWDHAHHRVTPPLRHLDGLNPVGQGWVAGRAAFGARCLRATAAVRQWLALRLQAWQQGAVFEEVQVNPNFLARIDTEQCPVNRQPLTLCAALDSDATVSRLNPAAAYAAGNLAVISQQAAAAWAQAGGGCGGGSDWQAAMTQAERLANGDDGEAAALLGLDRVAWLRLAVLASFATPLAHAQAALLPLRVLPPNRVRVINPVQALQVMLTLQFSQAGYARRLLGLAALMPNGEARQAFQIFMHTLLARRLAVGATPTPLQLRQAMEDTWGDVLVNRRWQRLATWLTAADCEQLLQRASQRGLVVGGSRWLSRESATEGWALDQAVAGSGAVKPGNTRSRGSQKLASCAGLTTSGSRQ
ncbi:MAG: hypothetical protein A3E25_23075 [Burkholderiales bacterium RIFCSPHIGHO2_12_FULL_69_20]|nr:MAG: hypothetical protein A3E25_23075 [Burkholderiales bacterium RIFCSPHIGHO2_12_FULL_69_20]